MRKKILTVILIMVIALIIKADEIKKGIVVETITEEEKANKVLWGKSWAVLVGINNYDNDPWNLYNLKYAAKDVIELGKILIEQYGFDQENVFLLLDKKTIEKLSDNDKRYFYNRNINIATKSNIENSINDLMDSKRIKEDDRVLLFFSGHGHTITTKQQVKSGYIIPSDGKGKENVSVLEQTNFPMEQIKNKTKKIPAKHVLILVSACYSGLSADNMKGRAIKTPLTYAADNPVRHIITGGTEGEQEIEKDEWQHSAFAYVLLQALKTRAPDSNRDGYMSSSELFAYLRPEVSKASDNRQTPQQGFYLLPTAKKDGEFLFGPREYKIQIKDKEGNSILSVEYLPEGSEVYINGNKIGNTPVKDMHILSGRNLIIVKKDEYNDRIVEVFLDEGERKIVSGNLEKIEGKKGFLTVDSTPWGTVYLDEEEIGITPLVNIKTGSGTHTIEIRPKSRKYKMIKDTIIINPEKEHKFYWRLPKE